MLYLVIAVVYSSASTRSPAEFDSGLNVHTLYLVLNAPLHAITQRQKGSERLDGMSFSQTMRTLLYPVLRVAFSLFAYSNQYSLLRFTAVFDSAQFNDSCSN